MIVQRFDDFEEQRHGGGDMVAELLREKRSELELVRLELIRRSVELEQRALWWRLLAGAVGFALGYIAGVCG